MQSISFIYYSTQSCKIGKVEKNAHGRTYATTALCTKSVADFMQLRFDPRFEARLRFEPGFGAQLNPGLESRF